MGNGQVNTRADLRPDLVCDVTLETGGIAVSIDLFDSLSLSQHAGEHTRTRVIMRPGAATSTNPKLAAKRKTRALPHFTRMNIENTKEQEQTQESFAFEFVLLAIT